VIRSQHELSEKLHALYKRMTQAINYKLLRANNALSTLAQNAVFARMQDSIARRQQRLDDLGFRLVQAQSRRLKELSRRLETLEAHLRRYDPRVRVGVMRRELEARTAELISASSRLFVSRDTQVDRLTVALGRAGETILLRRRSRWERLQSNLQALSPTAILARGYALVFDTNGHLVTQAAQVKPGEQVRTQLGRGEFTAEVKLVDGG
jgi:exodeoxyribonuclease VII large subunit